RSSRPRTPSPASARPPPPCSQRSDAGVGVGLPHGRGAGPWGSLDADARRVRSAGRPLAVVKEAVGRGGRMLKVGDTAPPIDAVGSEGSRFVLYEQDALCIVIYFFPKAFTPGCTVETREFRKHYVELEIAGAAVVGVSTDDLDTQCRFAGSLKVPFPILG